MEWWFCKVWFKTQRNEDLTCLGWYHKESDILTGSLVMIMSLFSGRLWKEHFWQNKRQEFKGSEWRKCFQKPCIISSPWHEPLNTMLWLFQCDRFPGWTLIQKRNTRRAELHLHNPLLFPSPLSLPIIPFSSYSLFLSITSFSSPLSHCPFLPSICYLGRNSMCIMISSLSKRTMES